MSGTEFRPGVDFAEVAEALKVETGQVIAMQNRADIDATLVIYTPGWPEDETAYGAVLERDEDEIFVLRGEPFEMPGFAEGINDLLKGGPE